MARLLLNWGNEMTRSFKSARDADAVAIGIWGSAFQDADPVGSSPIQTLSAVQDDQAFPPAKRIGTSLEFQTTRNEIKDLDTACDA
jgi:hypothetical protein